MLLNYPEKATMCRTGFLVFSGVIFSGERFSDECLVMATNARRVARRKGHAETICVS
jgi:hypothetical protein